jgi:hypothetical protein
LASKIASRRARRSAPLVFHRTTVYFQK